MQSQENRGRHWRKDPKGWEYFSFFFFFFAVVSPPQLTKWFWHLPRRTRLKGGINKVMICSWRKLNCCCCTEKWFAIWNHSFSFSRGSSSAPSSHHSQAYRSGNQLSDRKVVFNAGPDGLGLNSRGNWNEQLKQSVLGRQTAKGQCPAGLRGGKYDCLLSMKGPKNNSPGNQFPSHLLQTTGGLRKRGNMREREWERERMERGRERDSNLPFLSLLYFFFPLSLPKPFPQQSALATKRHLQSIMINSLHLSHLFP